MHCSSWGPPKKEKEQNVWFNHYYNYCCWHLQFVASHTHAGTNIKKEYKTNLVHNSDSISTKFHIHIVIIYTIYGCGLTVQKKWLNTLCHAHLYTPKHTHNFLTYCEYTNDRNWERILNYQSYMEKFKLAAHGNQFPRVFHYFQSVAHAHLWEEAGRNIMMKVHWGYWSAQ